jgi:hypothetical protein
VRLRWPTEKQDLAKWWKDLDVTKMVKDGLKDFGLSILTSGLESGGKWVLGRLLDDWGLKDVKDFLLPKSDTQKIIEMLQELTIRVNNLQKTSDAILKEVAGINYQQTVQPSIDLISTIKTVQQDIVGLLALKDDDPGRVGATKDILNMIQSQIAPKRGLINELMLQTGPGGDGIIRAASKKAALRDRWFTAEDSQAVFDVYKYFAIYQLRMANLLVEYWNTRSCTNTPVPPDCLSPTTIEQRLDQFQNDIDAQTALLKPPLPPGTFIDRATMRMWPTASWPLNGQDALNWTSVWQPRRCVDTTRKRTCTGSSESPYALPRRTNLSLPVLGPWTDWQTPSEDDFKSLIDGWEGDSPLAWLHKNTGFLSLCLSRQSQRTRPARPARLVPIGVHALGHLEVLRERVQRRPVNDQLQRHQGQLHRADGPLAAGPARRLLVSLASVGSDQAAPLPAPRRARLLVSADAQQPVVSVAFFAFQRLTRTTPSNKSAPAPRRSSNPRRASDASCLGYRAAERSGRLSVQDGVEHHEIAHRPVRNAMRVEDDARHGCDRAPCPTAPPHADLGADQRRTKSLALLAIQAQAHRSRAAMPALGV